MCLTAPDYAKSGWVADQLGALATRFDQRRHIAGSVLTLLTLQPSQSVETSSPRCAQPLFNFSASVLELMMRKQTPDDRCDFVGFYCLHCDGCMIFSILNKLFFQQKKKIGQSSKMFNNICYHRNNRRVVTSPQTKRCAIHGREIVKAKRCKHSLCEIL